MPDFSIFGFGSGSITFDWPWVFAALPLPLLVRYLLPRVQAQRSAALRVPFIDDFGEGDDPARAPRRRWLLLPAILAWLLLITAAARPQWLGDPLELPISGRDLMLAVDLSGSMEQEDFEIDGRRVNRLIATKWVAGDFIERREGDRIGLILFGDQAYLQAPLTFDRKTVRELLNESAIGLAGKYTAIGDAIGLAVKRLRNKEVQDRVLILLTDGANTAGEVKPLQAAELAAREGLKIYTIGIGADRMTVRSLLGRQVINPSRDLDEETLTAIADATGGRYFRARDTEELNEIYRELDRLEPTEKDGQIFRPQRALYPWPLAAALLLAGLIPLLPPSRTR